MNYLLEFKGEKGKEKTRKSPITGKEELYFPPKKRRMLIVQSSVASTTLVFVVIGVVRISY